MKRESIPDGHLMIAGTKRAVFRPGRWITFCSAHAPRLWRRSWGVGFAFWRQVLISEIGPLHTKENLEEWYNADLNISDAISRWVKLLH